MECSLCKVQVLTREWEKHIHGEPHLSQIRKIEMLSKTQLLLNELTEEVQTTIQRKERMPISSRLDNNMGSHHGGRSKGQARQGDIPPGGAIRAQEERWREGGGQWQGNKMREEQRRQQEWETARRRREEEEEKEKKRREEDQKRREEEARRREREEKERENRWRKEERAREETRLHEEQRQREEARLRDEARQHEEARQREEAQQREIARQRDEERLRQESRLREEERLREDARRREARREEARLQELRLQELRREEMKRKEEALMINLLIAHEEEAAELQRKLDMIESSQHSREAKIKLEKERELKEGQKRQEEAERRRIQFEIARREQAIRKERELEQIDRALSFELQELQKTEQEQRRLAEQQQEKQLELEQQLQAEKDRLEEQRKALEAKEAHLRAMKTTTLPPPPPAFHPRPPLLDHRPARPPVLGVPRPPFAALGRGGGPRFPRFPAPHRVQPPGAKNRGTPYTRREPPPRQPAPGQTVEPPARPTQSPSSAEKQSIDRRPPLSEPPHSHHQKSLADDKAISSLGSRYESRPPSDHQKPHPSTDQRAHPPNHQGQQSHPPSEQEPRRPSDWESRVPSNRQSYPPSEQGPRPPNDQQLRRPSDLESRVPSNQQSHQKGPHPPSDQQSRPPNDWEPRLPHDQEPHQPDDQWSRPPSDQRQQRPRPPSDQRQQWPRPPSDQRQQWPHPPTDQRSHPSDDQRSRPPLDQRSHLSDDQRSRPPHDQRSHPPRDQWSRPHSSQDPREGERRQDNFGTRFPHSDQAPLSNPRPSSVDQRGLHTDHRSAREHQDSSQSARNRAMPDLRLSLSGRGPRGEQSYRSPDEDGAAQLPHVLPEQSSDRDDRRPSSAQTRPPLVQKSSLSPDEGPGTTTTTQEPDLRVIISERSSQTAPENKREVEPKAGNLGLSSLNTRSAISKVRCVVCDLYISNHKFMAAHMASTAHRQREGRGGVPGSGVGDSGSHFYCAVCKQDSADEDSFSAHCESEEHKRAEQPTAVTSKSATSKQLDLREKLQAQRARGGARNDTSDVSVVNPDGTDRPSTPNSAETRRDSTGKAALDSAVSAGKIDSSSSSKPIPPASSHVVPPKQGSGSSEKTKKVSLTSPAEGVALPSRVKPVPSASTTKKIIKLRRVVQKQDTKSEKDPSSVKPVSSLSVTQPEPKGVGASTSKDSVNKLTKEVTTQGVKRTNPEASKSAPAQNPPPSKQTPSQRSARTHPTRRVSGSSFTPSADSAGTSAPIPPAKKAAPSTTARAPRETVTTPKSPQSGTAPAKVPATKAPLPKPGTSVALKCLPATTMAAEKAPPATRPNTRSQVGVATKQALPTQGGTVATKKSPPTQGSTVKAPPTQGGTKQATPTQGGAKKSPPTEGSAKKAPPTQCSTARPAPVKNSPVATASTKKAKTPTSKPTAAVPPAKRANPPEPTSTSKSRKTPAGGATSTPGVVPPPKRTPPTRVSITSPIPSLTSPPTSSSSAASSAKKRPLLSSSEEPATQKKILTEKIRMETHMSGTVSETFITEEEDALLLSNMTGDHQDTESSLDAESLFYTDRRGDNMPSTGYNTEEDSSNYGTSELEETDDFEIHPETPDFDMYDDDSLSVYRPFPSIGKSGGSGASQAAGAGGRGRRGSVKSPLVVAASAATLPQPPMMMGGDGGAGAKVKGESEGRKCDADSSTGNVDPSAEVDCRTLIDQRKRETVPTAELGRRRRGRVKRLQRGRGVSQQLGGGVKAGVLGFAPDRTHVGYREVSQRRQGRGGPVRAFNESDYNAQPNSNWSSTTPPQPGHGAPNRAHLMDGQGVVPVVEARPLFNAHPNQFPPQVPPQHGRQDHAPYQQGHAPYQQEHDYQQDRTPYQQERPPYQERLPYQQDHGPYQQDRTPHQQDRTLHQQDHAPYQQDHTYQQQPGGAGQFSAPPAPFRRSPRLQKLHALDDDLGQHQGYPAARGGHFGPPQQRPMNSGRSQFQGHRY